MLVYGSWIRWKLLGCKRELKLIDEGAGDVDGFCDLDQGSFKLFVTQNIFKITCENIGWLLNTQNLPIFTYLLIQNFARCKARCVLALGQPSR